MENITNMQNATRLNRTLEDPVSNSVNLNTELNLTIGSNITNLTDSEVIVVDFRQFYKYGFEFILYGYFMPVWASMSIIMYALMITVFIRYGMTSKTHICLIAIAICDSVSPIAPTSIWVYFFAIKKHYYYLPFEWCKIYHYTTEVIPQFFTYTSYFITIMMTVQRYIMVAHPFKAEKLCSKTVVYVMIVLCFLTSVAIRLVHLFHYKYSKTSVPGIDNANTTMQACTFSRPDWMPVSFYTYLGFLMTAQTIIVGVIPCTVLVVSELLMIKAINARSAKRETMTSKAKGQSHNAKNERRLTIATICITAVTLFYMVPVVIIQVIDVLVLMFDFDIGDYNNLRTAIVVLNVLYWMCIPSNFLITCCLSREFRRGIRSLFIKPKTVQNTIISIVSLAKTQESVCNSETTESVKGNDSETVVDEQKI
ncbi:sex peptide receptor-like [Mytilus edulis]|uniref:sex peptide receptor-like n=1 Tax=Mytilus edulis TaxID=6550 RepID=UPI0039EF1264